MMLPVRGTRLDERLSPEEHSAVRLFVWRVLNEVPAELVEAALFGSKARAAARADSDVDVLLVFRSLPLDREPQAGMAEAIAAEVARLTRIPVTVWSVALVDTLEGNRTPMLVDALEDAIPIWCWPDPLPPLSFTRADALRCVDALLARVEEGGAAFAAARASGDHAAALRRARDDLVRLCTALHLLDGITRPRRAESIEFVLRELPGLPEHLVESLDWARLSFGPEGRDEDAPLDPAGPQLPQLARAVDSLRLEVVSRGRQLARRSGNPGWLG